MKRRDQLLAGLGLALAVSASGFAQAPRTFVLDPFYGNNGASTYEWPASQNQIWSSANAWGTYTTSGRFAVLTALRDGGLDVGAVNWFEPGGGVTPPRPGGAGFAPLLLPGPVAGMVSSLDTSLAIARSRQLSAQDIDFQLFRMNHDGTDSYNGCNGSFFQNISFDLAAPLYMQDYASAIVQDVFGRQIIAGSAAATGGEGRLAVARVQPQCGLDITFNGTGKQVVDTNPFVVFPPPRTARGNTVAVDASHRVLIGGGVAYGLNPNDNGACTVTRLTQGGVRDSSFGNNGAAYIDNVTGRPGAWRCDVRGLAVQPDGRILVNMDWVLRDGADQSRRHLNRRLNENGSIDTSWSGCCDVGFANAEVRSSDVAVLPQDGMAVLLHNEFIRGPTDTRARGRASVQRLADGGFESSFLHEAFPFIQESFALHDIVVESPDSFLLIATSGPDMNSHRRVHVLRYRRVSTLPTDVIFRDGFQS